MKRDITDSQLHIWRTLFAVAHADDIVTDEEVQFMAHVMEEVDFTEEQLIILKDDISNPKNAKEMFYKITTREDRVKFFDLARDLVWADGDFDEAEQSVMVQLHQIHIKDTNMDSLIGKVSLELEEEPLNQKATAPQEKKKGKFLGLFKKRFSNDS